MFDAPWVLGQAHGPDGPQVQRQRAEVPEELRQRRY